MKVKLENQLQKVCEYEDSIRSLSKYDKDYFSSISDEGYDVIIKKSYKGKRIKNGFFRKCTFENVDFKHTGGAGTKFINCTFNDCNFNGANFQFCDFTGSLFRGSIPIESSNFNQSVFNNVTFENVSVKNTSISQAQFVDTKFNNVCFEYSTMQENLFANAIFSNVSFTEANLEYSVFNDIKMDNTTLPFHQVPYILGSLQYLTSTKDIIKIEPANSTSGSSMSHMEYLELMPLFCNYYKKHFEYFPLINIYLAAQQFDDAYEAIEEGLKHNLCMKDFRRLKMICKLAAQSKNYERGQLLSLYQIIVNSYMSIEFSESDRYYYSMHINEIKDILLNPYIEKNKLQLIIATNITSDNYESLTTLLQILEECMLFCNISPDLSEIDIRHNSIPFSIFSTIYSQNVENIAMFLAMVESIFTADNSLIIDAINLSAGAITIAGFIKNVYDRSRQPIVDNNLNDISIPLETISFVKNKRALVKENNFNAHIKLSLFHGLEIDISNKRLYK